MQPDGDFGLFAFLRADATEEALKAIARITEGEDFYAALAKGLDAMVLAWRGARPVWKARWLKSVDRAVASLRRGECAASVPPPALCSGA